MYFMFKDELLLALLRLMFKVVYNIVKILYKFVALFIVIGI